MFKDLKGNKYGRWTVIEQAESRRNTEHNMVRYWLCECECGTVREVKEGSLISGKSKSCGCMHRDIMSEVGKERATHGMTNSRIYRIYRHIINRCYNENDIRYDNYGARGITVCDEWMKFENFYEWAMSNGYDDTLTIDRINVDLGYFPENCRWTDNVTQCNNRTSTKLITYNNETHSIKEWAKILNMPYKKLWKRIHVGWDIERAFNE